MTLTLDPEGSETRALLDMVTFAGKDVLEIGCGDGRLTWRYADRAARVTAIDPSESEIALARENIPAQLRDRIEFHASAFEDYAAGRTDSAHDIAILSWSLC